jgi:hypothetical protein
VDPDEILAVVQTQEAARYTDVEQFPWFAARLNASFGGYCDVRLDTADGTTIRWFENYTLPLGSWLLRGNTACTDEQLKTGALRPVSDWPAE